MNSYWNPLLFSGVLIDPKRGGGFLGQRAEGNARDGSEHKVASLALHPLRLRSEEEEEGRYSGGGGRRSLLGG